MCSECIAVVVQRKHTGLMPRRRGSNPTAASNSGDYSNTQHSGLIHGFSLSTTTDVRGNARGMWQAAIDHSKIN